MSAADGFLALVRHPASALIPVSAVQARVSIAGDDTLVFTYRIRGDLDRLRLPAPLPPARVDGLWRHTCCEVFVAPTGEAAYREFNFSPSRQWAAYAFRAYRQRDDGIVVAAAPVITLGRREGELALEAKLGSDALPYCAAGTDLQLALSAVIEDADGNCSFWALRHPAGAPDFHHRDAFALTLADPRPGAERTP